MTRDTDKLTIEDIESYIAIHNNSKNPVLEVYKQLADTMRENARLRYAIQCALETSIHWTKICENALSNKESADAE